MPINSDKLQNAMQTWNSLVKHHQGELGRNLPELNLSALSSWPSDCFISFVEILANIESIARTAPNDYESVHEKVVDIFWQLAHIKNHIIDAEMGFEALMDLLAAKSEVTEDK